MQEWDGIERRGMDRDWVERDRMLTEVHSDMKHMVRWAEDHTKDDDTRFAVVTKDIDAGKKIVWSGIGIIITLEVMLKFFK